MPNTKTQAQKRAEREQRQQESEAKRREEKEKRDLDLQKNLPAKGDEQTPILSKKERRKQKPQQITDLDFKEEINLATVSATSATNQNEPLPTFDITMAKEKLVIKLTEESAKLAVRAEALSIAVTANPARMVQNHSTHCDGLKPVLIRLQKSLPDCTIIPGELSRNQNHCETFELLYQRMVDKNTYKLVARNGHTAQDVLINVPDPKNFTVEILKDCLEKALTSPSEHTSKAFEADLPSSTYNKMVQQERNTLWRIQHQENDAIKKQREGAIKKQKKVKAQARKLAAKGIPANQLEATAERDAAIISGETRTKHSMG